MHMSLFVAYLHKKALAPQSIATYLSAIGFMHKINGVGDPTDTFLVRKLLIGLRRRHNTFDLRLPITSTIVDRLVDSLSFTCSSIYNQQLYAAMFLLAFTAFLRIGEITISGRDNSNNIPLSSLDITSVCHMRLTMHHYKHHYTGRPHILHLEGKPTAAHCPIMTMTNYISVRGKKAGPLFALRNGMPVPRSTFNTVLKQCLNFCGLDTSRYKGHSFRIGAATAAMNAGFSDAQIRHFGRWHSDAFKRYIRG